eukprot:COSAG04_NODE_2793_length_3568_cov_1.739694_1_plen_25_part_10
MLLPSFTPWFKTAAIVVHFIRVSWC